MVRNYLENCGKRQYPRISPPTYSKNGLDFALLFPLWALLIGLGASLIRPGASPSRLGASPSGLRPHETTPRDDPTRRPDRVINCDFTFF